LLGGATTWNFNCVFINMHGKTTIKKILEEVAVIVISV
jgi:hypothetical protein